MFAGRSFGLLAAASLAGLALSSDPAFAGRHSGASCAPSGAACARPVSSCGPRYGYGYGYGGAYCGSGLSLSFGFSSGSAYSAGYYNSGACYRPYRPVYRSYPYCPPRWSYAGCPTIYSPTVVYTVPAYRTQLAVADSSWVNSSPVVVTDSNSAYHQWQAQQPVQTFRNPDPQPSVAAAAAPTGAVQQSPPPAAQPAAEVANDQQGLNDAWALIGRGESAGALTRFARLCDGNPGWAPPRAGYSVAAAMEGKLDTAAWGFRRAFADGGSALGFLPESTNLDGRLADLSTRLRALAATQSGDIAGETWFVIAGVDYLRHDIRGATEASQKAQLLGQNHESFRNLLALLD